MLNKFEVCIVGMGPAWLGMASQISGKMEKRLICFEAGDEVENRSCQYLESKECKECSTCHMIAGVGGCSILSSGKISGYPAGSKMKKIIGGEEETKRLINESLDVLKEKIDLQRVEVSQKVYEQMIPVFESEDIEYKYYDVYKFSHHELKKLFFKEKSRLENLGAKIYTNEEVVDISRENHFYKVVTTKRNIIAKKVVLALGKSGEHLIRKVIEKKYIDVEDNFIDAGIRIECPNELLNDISELHGDIKLKYKDTRTYCYSAKGKVVGYRLNNHLFTEGYSDLVLDSGSTNFAVLTRINSYCKEYYEMLKWYYNNDSSTIIKIPILDFMNKKGNVFSLIYTNSILNDLRNASGKFLNVLLKENDYSNIFVYGPEMDIVPCKVKCDKNFMVGKDLYVIGAGCGHFRGILQSYSSGVKCVKKIMEG